MRSARCRISATARWQDTTRKMFSKTTHAACSTQRHWLAARMPYTDWGQQTPRRKWSAATTTVARPRPRLGHSDEFDARAPQRGHHAPVFLVRRVDGRQAEPGGEHAVECGRRAAALDVAEHGCARLEARA